MFELLLLFVAAAVLDAIPPGTARHPDGARYPVPGAILPAVVPDVILPAVVPDPIVPAVVAGPILPAVDPDAGVVHYIDDGEHDVMISLPDTLIDHDDDKHIDPFPEPGDTFQGDWLSETPLSMPRVDHDCMLKCRDRKIESGTYGEEAEDSKLLCNFDCLTDEQFTEVNYYQEYLLNENFRLFWVNIGETLGTGMISLFSGQKYVSFPSLSTCRI